jgi:hypothetical protein
MQNTMELRVMSWLDTNRLLIWQPILSADNFPEIPQDILKFANAQRAAFHCLIRVIEDFSKLPEGVTGWLLPSDEADTDVACAHWQGEMHFLQVLDKRTGQPQTLLGQTDGSPSMEPPSSQAITGPDSQNHATD